MLRGYPVYKSAGQIDLGSTRVSCYIPGVKKFANFITHTDTTWWLTCDTAVDARWNDLTIYRHLYAYK